MDPETRVPCAGLALAAALFVLSVLSLPWTGSEPCARPVERRAEGGHTRAVGCAERGDSGRPVRGPARRLFGLPIDVNRADPATLMSLPGIGPARAEGIVAERARRPFAGVDDLERVPGLGPVLVGRLRGHVVARPLALGAGSR